VALEQTQALAQSFLQPPELCPGQEGPLKLSGPKWFLPSPEIFQLHQLTPAVRFLEKLGRSRARGAEAKLGWMLTS
jgi:hypothetical protein